MKLASHLLSFIIIFHSLTGIRIAFDAEQYALVEDDNFVQVCIELEGRLERDVVVNLMTLELPSNTARGKFILFPNVSSYPSKSFLSFPPPSLFSPFSYMYLLSLPYLPFPFHPPLLTFSPLSLPSSFSLSLLFSFLLHFFIIIMLYYS